MELCWCFANAKVQLGELYDQAFVVPVTVVVNSARGLRKDLTWFSRNYTLTTFHLNATAL